MGSGLGSRPPIQLFKCLVVVVVFLVLGNGRSAHAAGVTLIHPDTTDVWRLDASDPQASATLMEIPLPNCVGAPCPVDVITVFSSGYVNVLSNLAGISQIVQVTNTQYVVATGSCAKGSCDLGAYAVNRQRQATAALLVANPVAFSAARCGLRFTYAGGTYTLKPVLAPLQGTGPGFFLPQVFAGVPVCH